eukprot:557297-Pelagomonas_calceolata.AAC.2
MQAGFHKSARGGKKCNHSMICQTFKLKWKLNFLLDFANNHSAGWQKSGAFYAGGYIRVHEGKNQ